MDSLLSLLNKYSIIDLSHSLEEGMPVWFTHPKFYQNEVDSLEKKDVSYLNQLILGEHCGTHVDAQSHFIKNGWNIDEMPLDQLVGRAYVIDISNLPDNGVATKTLIQEWEQENISVQKDDIVCFYTGQEKYWGLKPDHQKFMVDWRGLSKDGAMYLQSKGVKAVGTDAMALDAFENDGTHPAHQVLLGAGIPIIENLAHLSDLKGEFLFMAFPLKIKQGSASPMRAIAYI
ncbi:cyclase family protein [Ignatzschineria sp. LJL83]